MQQKYKVFMIAAEELNFSRAAERLFISQPGVTQYIQSLEKEFGAKLFHRKRKEITLTKAGEIVYQHVRELERIYTSMYYRVEENRSDVKGELTVGSSYTFGEYVLPQIISRLLKKYPSIQPTIFIGNTKEICERVYKRKLDIGIVEGDHITHDLHTVHLSKDKMVVVFGRNHPLAKKQEITIRDLGEETWIIREKGSGTREAVDRLFSAFQLSPSRTMEFGSTQIIKESVEEGLGITLLSEWAIRKEIQLGTLCTVAIQELGIERDFTIVKHTEEFEAKTIQVFQQEAEEYLISKQERSNGR